MTCGRIFLLLAVHWQPRTSNWSHFSIGQVFRMNGSHNNEYCSCLTLSLLADVILVLPQLSMYCFCRTQVNVYRKATNCVYAFIYLWRDVITGYFDYILADSLTPQELCISPRHTQKNQKFRFIIHNTSLSETLFVMLTERPLIVDIF